MAEEIVLSSTITVPDSERTHKKINSMLLELFCRVITTSREITMSTSSTNTRNLLRKIHVVVWTLVDFACLVAWFYRRILDTKNTHYATCDFFKRYVRGYVRGDPKYILKMPPTKLTFQFQNLDPREYPPETAPPGLQILRRLLPKEIKTKWDVICQKMKSMRNNPFTSDNEVIPSDSMLSAVWPSLAFWDHLDKTQKALSENVRGAVFCRGIDALLDPRHRDGIPYFEYLRKAASTLMAGIGGSRLGTNPPIQYISILLTPMENETTTTIKHNSNSFQNLSEKEKLPHACLSPSLLTGNKKISGKATTGNVSKADPLSFRHLGKKPRMMMNPIIECIGMADKERIVGLGIEATSHICLTDTANRPVGDGNMENDSGSVASVASVDVFPLNAGDGSSSSDRDDVGVDDDEEDDSARTQSISPASEIEEPDSADKPNCKLIQPEGRDRLHDGRTKTKGLQEDPLMSFSTSSRSKKTVGAAQLPSKTMMIAQCPSCKMDVTKIEVSRQILDIAFDRGIAGVDGRVLWQTVADWKTLAGFMRDDLKRKTDGHWQAALRQHYIEYHEGQCYPESLIKKRAATTLADIYRDVVEKGGMDVPAKHSFSTFMKTLQGKGADPLKEKEFGELKLRAWKKHSIEEKFTDLIKWYWNRQAKN